MQALIPLPLREGPGEGVIFMLRGVPDGSEQLAKRSIVRATLCQRLRLVKKPARMPAFALDPWPGAGYSKHGLLWGRHLAEIKNGSRRKFDRGWKPLPPDSDRKATELKLCLNIANNLKQEGE